MTDDDTRDTYAGTLRSRYAAVAPRITVDPTAVTQAARRRRARTWTAVGAAVTLVAAIAVGSTLWRPGGGTVQPATPPPPAEPSDVSLWLSAEEVPTAGAEVAAVLVNHTGVDVTFGVLAEVERWTGSTWDDHRQVGMCLDHWHCTARLTTRVEAVEDIGLSPTSGLPGPVERFSTEGLDPGWYRISQTANEGVVASGILRVADDAAAPAPLWPTDAVAFSVQPVIVAADGGPVTLYPLVRPNADGSLSIEDVEAAVEELSATAVIERWQVGASGAEGTWVTAGEVEVRLPDAEQTYAEVVADLPALDPGAYRLSRTGPSGTVTGSFWVLDAAG